MPRLPDSTSSEPFNERLSRILKAQWKQLPRSIMRSRSLQMPRSIPELPLRLRPWFLLFTSLIMLFLALLGFTNIAKDWPLNDKILHFICLSAATGVFYFIIDVDEDARRIWFWRWAGVIITVVTCFFFGGIVSEIVKSLLPSKTFQFGDVVANLLGSSIGLYIAFHLEKHYRARREIARLYQPLQADDGLEDDEEEVGPDGAYSSLPLYRPPSKAAPSRSAASGGPPPSATRNVWDTSDTSITVFDIGDEDEMDSRPLAKSSPRA